MGIFSPDNSSSDMPGFSSDLSEPASTNNSLFEKELEDFWIREKEKLHMHAQVHEYNDICWEKCSSEVMGSKLNKKGEACLSNCVDRFVDTSMFILNRFASNIKKNAV